MPQAPLSTDKLAAQLELLGSEIFKVVNVLEDPVCRGILGFFNQSAPQKPYELRQPEKCPYQEVSHDQKIQSLLRGFATETMPGRGIQSAQMYRLSLGMKKHKLTRPFVQRCQCGILDLDMRNNISTEKSFFSQSDWISKWARAYIEAINILELTWRYTEHLHSVHQNLQKAVEKGRQHSLGKSEVMPRYLAQDRFKDCEKYLQALEPDSRWEQEVWLQGVVDVLGARLNETVPPAEVVSQMGELKQSLEFIRLEASSHF